MTIKTLARVAALCAVLGATSQVALAEHYCSASIGDAKSAINWNADEFLSKNADRDIQGLLDKLAAAESKLNFGDAIDAAQKIADAQDKVDELYGAPKPKLGPVGYDAIAGALEEVQACLRPFLPST